MQQCSDGPRVGGPIDETFSIDLFLLAGWNRISEHAQSDQNQDVIACSFDTSHFVLVNLEGHRQFSYGTVREPLGNDCMTSSF